MAIMVMTSLTWNDRFDRSKVLACGALAQSRAA